MLGHPLQKCIHAQCTYIWLFDGHVLLLYKNVISISLSQFYSKCSEFIIVPTPPQPSIYLSIYSSIHLSILPPLIHPLHLKSIIKECSDMSGCRRSRRRRRTRIRKKGEEEKKDKGEGGEEGEG